MSAFGALSRHSSGGTSTFFTSSTGRFIPNLPWAQGYAKRSKAAGVSIRKGVAADQAAIERLVRDNITADWDFFEDGREWIVAEAGGKVVGALSMYGFTSNEHAVVILHEIATDPVVRGKGVGVALMMVLGNFATAMRRSNKSAVIAGTCSTQGKGFYSALGFAVHGRVVGTLDADWIVPNPTYSHWILAEIA